MTLSVHFWPSIKIVTCMSCCSRCIVEWMSVSSRSSTRIFFRGRLCVRARLTQRARSRARTLTLSRNTRPAALHCRRGRHHHSAFARREELQSVHVKQRSRLEGARVARRVALPPRSPRNATRARARQSFPKKSHFICGQTGWEEIATFVHEWIHWARKQ